MPAVDYTHQLELQRLMRDAPSRRAAHQATQRAASCREEEAECTPPTTDDETRYASKALPCAPPPPAKRALSQPVIGSTMDEEVLLKIFCLVRAATNPLSLANHRIPRPHSLCCAPTPCCRKTSSSVPTAITTAIASCDKTTAGSRSALATACGATSSVCRAGLRHRRRIGAASTSAHERCGAMEPSAAKYISMYPVGRQPNIAHGVQSEGQYHAAGTGACCMCVLT